MFHQMRGADPTLSCWEKNNYSYFEQNCCELPELQITFKFFSQLLREGFIKKKN